MNIPSKTEAIKAIDRFAQELDKVASYIDTSSEPLPYWAKVLGLTTPAISNKKAGRRDWKLAEIRGILEASGKDVKIVDDYIFVIDNIDNMINIRGYKKQFIYHKAGLTNMQIQVRNQSKKKDYSSWKVDEIRRIVEAL